MPKHKNMEVDQYITVSDLIERFSISKTKAYEIATSGELETLRIGRCLRISVPSVVEWISLHSET